MGLTASVYVRDDDGNTCWFGPEDVVPEWAARKMGAHCFDGDVHPYADDAPHGDVARSDAQEPPRAGKGSSREVWAEYAAGHVTVDDDDSRDAIIAKLVAADIIQE